MTDEGEMAIAGVQSEAKQIERPLSPPVRAQAPQPRGATGQPGGAFGRALRALSREIDVGEAHTAAASHLRSYDAGTLIALQVGIYRYTEAVDLASKLVDRATNAVRTVLQGGGH